MNRSQSISSPAMIVLAAAMCISLPAESDDGFVTVSGTAGYRQRIAMPPEAILTVRVEDVSRADVAAPVLAETSEAFGDRQVPIAYSLKVPGTAVDPKRAYTVRATITVDGKMRFATTRSYPVLTRGAPDKVDLLLDAVGHKTTDAGPMPTPMADTGTTQSWRGAFRHVADAATFTECSSGRQWPVAMTADYPAMERHYVEVRSAPAAPLVVTFDGRPELLPAMEGEPREQMVIEQFIGSEPAVACDSGQHLSVANLKDTYWKLIEIDGEKVVMVEGQRREVRITLASKDPRVIGFSGCNQLMGSYRQEGAVLRFSQMAGTMMACMPPLMDLERKVLKAIGATTGYRIDGEQLTLMADDQVLARFESVYLK